MLATLLLGLGAGYVLLVVLLYLWQDRLLYYPAASITLTPADRGLVYEAVTLPTEDGERLHAWWVPAPDARGVLLFCHGNAGNLSGRVDTIARLHRLGLSVLAFDYRGYGQSTGTPSEEGLYRDARAAWRYLTQTQQVDPSAMVFFGRSLGSAVATWLATQHPPRALILEAPFTSVPDVAAFHYPYVPTRQLVRAQFDTARRLAALQVPVLLIHSPSDQVVPYEQGRALFEAAREPKAFLKTTGPHGAALFEDSTRYLEHLDRFLEQHGLPRNAAAGASS